MKQGKVGERRKVGIGKVPKIRRLAWGEGGQYKPVEQKGDAGSSP